jgi:MFS family permease
MAGPELLVLLTGAFMAQFDFFVVNVAAPAIRTGLSASSGQLELIVGIYAFGYASGLVLGGRLGDLLGHRRVYVWGTLAFAATSAACGAANGPGVLVAARLLQGLAAAAMLPQVLAIISARTHGIQRARAMAWYGVAGGLGSLAGQVLGGLLITADVHGLGWRLVFMINLPIGLLTAIASVRLVDAGAWAGRATARLDFLGAVGLATAVALVLVPLTLGRGEGWPPWIWVCTGIAVPVLAATVAWERSRELAGQAPLLPLHLFAVSSFRIGIASAAAFMAAFASYMFALALVLQVGYRLDPFHAGLAFAPSGLTFLAAALVTPRLPPRLGRGSCVGGSLVAAAALIALALVLAWDTGYERLGTVVAIAALVSLGNGAVYPSLLGMSLSRVPARDAGAGAGALATAQQFASAVGVAGLGTVFFAAAGPFIHAGAGSGMAWVAGIGAGLMVTIAALGTRLRRSSDPPDPPDSPDSPRSSRAPIRDIVDRSIARTAERSA